MAGDRLGAGVIGRKSQGSVAELVEHHQKVTGRAVEVLRHVVRIDAKIARSLGHELTETNGADRAERASVIGALDLDVGAVKQRPVGHRQTRAAQGAVACIAQRSSLDGLEDFRGSAVGARHWQSGFDWRFGAVRLGEEKDTIRLRISVTRERAQGARSFGDGDQLAVRANREDKAVGARQSFGGQGCNTNPCSQRKAERKRVISRS